MAVQSRNTSSITRRRWLIPLAVVLVLVAVVLFWFQPQKLIIDERVDDALPAAAPASPTAPKADTAPASPDSAPASPEPAPPSPEPEPEPAAEEPVDLFRGRFASRDHGTSGEVRVVELVDGRRIVRLEGLDTDNGPDLYLYLSTNAADGPEGAFDDDFVDLGRLQGNLGNQNYELPEAVDPAQYQSVVIWCDRFDSAFGAATLAAV